MKRGNPRGVQPVPYTPEQAAGLSEHELLCHWVVGKFAKIDQREFDYDEAVQCARLALLNSLRLYDPTLGKFSTYAVTAMKRALWTWRANRFRPIVKHHGTVPIVGSRSQDKILGLTYSMPDPSPGQQELKQWLARVLKDCLSPRDRYILSRRERDGASLREIAEEMGVSRERVRQICELSKQLIRRIYRQEFLDGIE